MLIKSHSSLIVDNLTVQRGDFVLCEQVSFLVDAGQAVHVLGKNGIGKSTLLLILASALPFYRGKLHWSNKPPQDWSALFVGHKSGLNSQLNVLQNLHYLLALQVFDLVPAAVIEHALVWAGLEGYEDQLVSQLSSGQRRRIQMARLFVDVHHAENDSNNYLTQRLWLLDEPLTAVDTDFSNVLQELMSIFLSRGGRIVFTSHQPLMSLEALNKEHVKTIDLSEYQSAFYDYGMMG